MAVDYRLQRRWRAMRGMLSYDVREVSQMLHTFGQRADETEAEWRDRLKRQNEEFAAKMDRLEESEQS